MTTIKTINLTFRGLLQLLLSCVRQWDHHVGKVRDKGIQSRQRLQYDIQKASLAKVGYATNKVRSPSTLLPVWKMPLC